jgi:hypothetical protein
VIGCIGGGKGQLAFWNEGEEKPFTPSIFRILRAAVSLHHDGLQVATTHHDKKLRITRLEPKAAT